MIIERIVVGALMVNCYLVGDEESNEGIIIDPGADADRVGQKVDELSLKITKVVATHGHVDHVGAVEPLKRRFNVPFAVHRADEWFLPHTRENGAMYGLLNLENPTADEYLAEGGIIRVGKHSFNIIEAPGHCQGAVILLGEGHAFVGDVLFAGSIGRTDLPGSSYEEMVVSLEKVLSVIPEDTVLHPGHGDSTSLAVEKQYNPFLQGLRGEIR